MCNDRREILVDDSTWKFRVLCFQSYTLMSNGATNINENRFLWIFVGGNFLERNSVQPLWQPSLVGLHPETEILKPFGTESRHSMYERRQVRFMYHLIRCVGVIRRKLIFILCKKFRRHLKTWEQNVIPGLRCLVSFFQFQREIKGILRMANTCRQPWICKSFRSSRSSILVFCDGIDRACRGEIPQ